MTHVRLIAVWMIAASFALPARSQEPSEPPDQTIALPVRPKGKYEFLSRPFPAEETSAILNSLPYESIQLKQWGQPSLLTFTPGTEYKITFTKSGTANYEGISGVKRIGKYSGEISLREYGKLCLLLERFGVNQKDCNLGLQVQVSHPVVADLDVLVVGEQAPRTFRNDSSFGDFRFWLIQSAIERVVADIEWTPTDGK